MNPHPDALRSFGFHVWEGAPERMVRAHAHPDIEVNFLLQGGMVYLLGEGRHRIAAGTLTAFWAALPHRLESVEPGTRCVWITAPVAWFLDPDLPRGGIGDLLAGRLLSAHRPDESGRIRTWAAEMEHPQPCLARAVGLEVQARLLRLGLEGRSQARTAAHVPLDHIQTMIEVMTRRFADELDIAAIARPTGLHPRWAMRVFKDALGLTIWEYLQRLRVGHAQHLLLDPQTSVLDAALASGFGSQARFYATFRRLIGQAPGEWRRHGRIPANL
jgi:AraC-like DNA-binding protein